jgi:cystathionine gamma-lyase
MRNTRPAFETRAVHAGQKPDPATGAVTVPIYATSTYAQESPGLNKGYAYGRTRNPTRDALEHCIADLEEGTRGFAFASGLAAIGTVLECLDQGAHVVATDDLYRGTVRLIEHVRGRSAGIALTLVDMSDPAAIEAAIRPNTRLIWVETPTNPLLKLVDLDAITRIGRRRGVLTAAGNTFATPWAQRPLAHGFDVVVHSTTKYLNGHSDVTGGVAVVGENPELADRLAFLQNATGGIASPFDCFLVLRGIKTLPLRMERQCAAHRRLVASPPGGTERALSGAAESPAARTGAATDAWVRRHDHCSTHSRSRENATCAGTRTTVHSGRELG